jgi:hypothetical protein
VSRVDFFASRPHYREHLWPIWRQVGYQHRGTFNATAVGDRPVVVASHDDLVTVRDAGRKNIALAQHGIGQSYSRPHSGYPGGIDQEDVGLFLVPNLTAAARTRGKYHTANIEVVGSPRLEDVPHRLGRPGRTVAISFHWRCRVQPEAGTVFDWYKRVLPDLQRSFHVLGHGHPRMIEELAPHYRDAGIPIVESFDEVAAQADLYVCDNSSTIFEFASTGRPVVVLNGPPYRRDTQHGLRFWEAARVGLNCEHPDSLVRTIEAALDDQEQRQREDALNIVYAHRDRPGQRAAEAIVAWA